MASQRESQKTAKVPAKRGRGRPVTTGTGTLIGVRCLDDLLDRIDTWRATQEGDVSRPDAIRRLAEQALAGTQPTKQRSPKARSKALDLASKQIDKLSIHRLTDVERQQRKRRLLKGPKEFQDIRADIRSKSKR